MTRNMISQTMALDQEQEMISAFMSTQPHSGGIHMHNYRKVAGESNAKKHIELQTILGQQSGIVKAELQVLMNQIQASLKSEISVAKVASDDKMKLLTDSQTDLKNDVVFVRHELKNIGEQITSLDHFVTKKNKFLLSRIEELEKDVIVLKTPPPKSEFRWGEFFLIIVFVAVAFAGFFLQRFESGPLMIGY